MVRRCTFKTAHQTIHMQKAAVLILALAAYPAAAEPLVVETDRSIYHYGDTLIISILVEEITEPLATMYIRDATGKTSSPIPIPLDQLRTQLPPAAPFDRMVFPEGVYEVDVTYGNLAATTSFELVDVGNIVVHNWIKVVALQWVSGNVSGADYLNALESLVDESLLTAAGGEPHIPTWVAIPTTWWLGGLISDEAYVTMLQYMADRGVVTGLTS